MPCEIEMMYNEPWRIWQVLVMVGAKFAVNFVFMNMNVIA